MSPLLSFPEIPDVHEVVCSARRRASAMGEKGDSVRMDGTVLLPKDPQGLPRLEVPEHKPAITAARESAAVRK